MITMMRVIGEREGEKKREVTRWRWKETEERKMKLTKWVTSIDDLILHLDRVPCLSLSLFCLLPLSLSLSLASFFFSLSLFYLSCKRKERGLKKGQNVTQRLHSSLSSSTLLLLFPFSLSLSLSLCFIPCWIETVVTGRGREWGWWDTRNNKGKLFLLYPISSRSTHPETPSFSLEVSPLWIFFPLSFLSLSLAFSHLIFSHSHPKSGEFSLSLKSFPINRDPVDLQFFTIIVISLMAWLTGEREFQRERERESQLGES